MKSSTLFVIFVMQFIITVVTLCLHKCKEIHCTLYFLYDELCYDNNHCY